MPFVLSVARMREIFGAKAADLTDEQLADIAKRMSEIVHLHLEQLAETRRAHAASAS